jgi:hypothetical protein
MLGVSRVVVDVGAPGGASGNFQGRVSTISLHGCGTSESISLGALHKKKKKKRKKKKKNIVFSIRCAYLLRIKKYLET